MSIEAIGAASGQAQSMNINSHQELSISEIGTQQQAAAGKTEFDSVLSNVYDSIQQFGASSPASPNAGAVSADPVAASKAELLPSPYEIHPTAETQGDTSVTNPGQNDGTEVLVKSFDHAISLALLNQVISGISSTTSSLIRQS